MESRVVSTWNQGGGGVKAWNILEYLGGIAEPK